MSETARRAIRYYRTVAYRPAGVSKHAIEELSRLRRPLNRFGEDPLYLTALLDDVGSPASTATTGGRYFGYVTGGAMPPTIAAHWLADTWDQDASLYELSPVSATSKRLSQDGSYSCLSYRRIARSALLRAARWRTLQRWQQPGTQCCSTPAGMLKARACQALRQ